MPELRVPIVVLASSMLLGACTQATEPGSVEIAKTPAPEVEPVAVPAPPAAVEPEPAQSPLRVVAVREGMVTLLRQRDAPLLVLEGEPVPLVDGTFSRHPAGSAGLWPEPYLEHADEAEPFAAVSLDEPLGGWTSLAQAAARSMSRHLVYRRRGAQWHEVPLRKGVLVAYYSALVERDGALLALRSWAPEADQALVHYDEEHTPAGKAHQAKVDHALARTKQAWVHIAGAETAAIPEIPAKTTLTGSVTTTANGTLMALAHAEERPSMGALVWRPGQTTAEWMELPAIDDTSLHALGSSGEWAFVGGLLDGAEPESYLALGRGAEWERVPVALPGHPAGVSVTVSGAARRPDGELWIALGDPYSGSGDVQPVWRKPVDGPWQPVLLPPVGGDAFGPATGWAYDSIAEAGWVMVERSQDPTVPERSLALVSAGDAVWVAVQGQMIESDVGFSVSRTVVLTTEPGAAPPAVLPSGWQLALERRNHAVQSVRPGHDDCRFFSIALGPATLATNAPTLVDALAGLTLEASVQDVSTGVRSIYTTRREGSEVLVAEAQAESPAQASALRDAVAAKMRAAGVPAGAIASDCRIPPLERMVATPKDP